MSRSYPFSIPSGQAILPEPSGVNDLGSPAQPFLTIYSLNISGNNIYENGQQVISSGIGLGNVTVTNSNGTLTISGATTSIPSNLVVSGSSTILNVLDVTVLSGTTISGNAGYFNSLTVNTEIDYNSIFASTVSGTTISGNNITALISLNSPLVSGTIISGGSIYANGQQVISSGIGLGNVTVTNANGILTISGTQYVLPNNLIVSGSSTILNVLDVTVLSGTTISGNIITALTELFSPVISGTIISGNTLNLTGLFNGTSANFSTIVNSPVISGTTISGNNATFNNLTVTNELVLSTINANVVSGTTVSGNNAYFQNLNVINPVTFSTVSVNVLSGTTISGNTLYLSGILNGNSAIFSGSIDASVISGTTISGNTVVALTIDTTNESISNLLSANVVSLALLSGTTAVITTISGGTIYENGQQVINSGVGLGNVTVTNANGILTISGNSNVFSGSFYPISGGILSGSMIIPDPYFIQVNTINNNGNNLNITSTSGNLTLTSNQNISVNSTGNTNITSIGQINLNSSSNIGLLSAGSINNIASGNYLTTSSGVIQLVSSSGINTAGSIVPLSSGADSVGSLNSPFLNSYAVNVYENGQQVINSGVGLGNVTVTSSNGVLTISGATTSIPTNLVVSGSSTILNVLDVTVLSGTTISGNAIFASGVQIIPGNYQPVGNYVVSGSSTILNVLDVIVLSGTTVSGNAIFASGVQIIPGNYQPTGNYVVSGSSTILNVLDVTQLSGTTVYANLVSGTFISGNTINSTTTISSVGSITSTGGNLVGNTAVLSAGVTANQNNAGLLLQGRSFTVSGVAVTMATGTANNSSGNFVAVEVNPLIFQSGTAGFTALQINPIIGASGTGLHLLFDAQVSGTSKFNIDANGDVVLNGFISGGSIYENGVQVANAISTFNNLTSNITNGNITVSGSLTPIFTIVDAQIISGTTISGNAIFASGVQLIPGNYQPVGNYIVSGSSTILNVLDVTVLSGTTISGNAFFLNGVALTNYVLPTSLTGLTLVDSIVLSGTTISGNQIYENGILVATQTDISNVSGIAATAVQNATNLGTGIGLFSSKSGTNLQFNSISGIGNITAALVGNVIQISTGAEPSGNYIVSGTSTILNILDVTVLSGTTISGNAIFASGVQLIPGNYQPAGNYVVSGSSTILNVLDVTVLSGTTISGNTIYENGIQVANSISVSNNLTGNLTNGAITISGSLTPTFTTVTSTTLNSTTVNSTVLSGTTISGNAIFASGVQIIPGNYQPTGNYVVSGSSTILNTLDITLLSGTTINGNNVTALTELFSPVVSGTTISGNTISVGVALSAQTSGTINIGSTSAPFGELFVTPKEYVYAYDTTTQTIVSGNTFQNINFATAFQLNGWTHASSGVGFTANVGGLYKVDCTSITSKTGGGNSPFEMRATVAGVEVSGSQIAYLNNTNNIQTPLSHSFITNVGSGQVLQIQMAASGTSSQIGGVGTNALVRPSATLVITRFI